MFKTGQKLVEISRRFSYDKKYFFITTEVDTININIKYKLVGNLVKIKMKKTQRGDQTIFIKY